MRVDHLPLPWHEGRRAAGELVLENGYGIGPIRPETRVCVAVHTYDERLTTVTAHRDLQAAGLSGRARRKVVDQEAASVILQSWLDQRQSSINQQEHDER